MNYNRPETIVFDVGGVLFADALEPKISDLALKYSIEESLLHEARRELRPAVDLGRLGEAEFWESLLQRSGVEPEAVDLTVEPYVREVAGVDAALDALGRQYRLAILSNDSKEMSWARRSKLKAEFAAVVISADVGVMKPDKEIYRILLERLEQPPASCLFIDDREENIVAAREIGMLGICFISWEQTLESIEKLASGNS